MIDHKANTHSHPFGQNIEYYHFPKAPAPHESVAFISLTKVNPNLTFW